MGVIADKIRRAIFGGEVRDSIADGIEVVEQLREDYDNQVINAGNSNAEIVDARGGQTKLKDRLDNFDEQLEHIEIEKASKVYVDTKIGNIGNTKTFKGSCLYSALPTSATVDDYWYVTDKTTNYCWNGETWIDIGNNLNIGDKTITQKKMTIPYVEARIKNLFNKNVIEENKFVMENGTIGNMNLLGVSEFIEIVGGTQYTFIYPRTTMHPFAYYDKDKSFISYVSNNTNKTVTTPSNAKYIRFTFWLEDIEKIQLEKGSISTEYEPFGYYIKDETLNIAFKYLNNKAIEENKNVYVMLSKSKNLFDKNAVTKNHYVDYKTGIIKELSGASVSEYIEIESNTEYVLSANNQNAFYDINKNFISGTTDNPFTTPSNAKYILVTTIDPNIDIQQLEKGSVSTTYTEYGYYIDNSLIKKEEVITINPNSNIIDILLNNQGKTIYVDGGEYDIIKIYKDYFGDDFFDTLPLTGAPKHYYGLPLFNGTKLICSPNAHFSCHYKGTNTNVIWGFSGFACGNGYELNGLNIDASNVKYAVHDDYNIYNDIPYFVKVENCHITNDKQAIGGGLGKYGTYEYKNNFIHATNNNYDMRYHNNKYTTKCKLSFVGNYFPNTLRLSYYGASEKDTTKCFVSNNYIGSDIMNDAETPEYTVNNMKVYQWNNTSS